jgi:hypothetical protein
MRNASFFLVFCLLVVFALTDCKKNSSQVITTPKTDSTYIQKILANVSKIGGARMWLGYGTGTGEGPFFLKLKISVISDSIIKGYSDMQLNLSSIDTVRKTIIFGNRNPPGFVMGVSTESEMITYNYLKDSIGDHYWYGTRLGLVMSLTMHSPDIAPISLLQKNISKIAGIKYLTGSCDSINELRVNTDSVYNLNDTISLAVVNDSIIVGKDFSGFLNDTLYYRSFDAIAGTITYMAYDKCLSGRSFVCDSLTITYNYVSNSFSFGLSKIEDIAHFQDVSLKSQ